MIIRCWLCQKEVDKLSMRYSELHMATIVTVWCHGEKDECYIADQTMAEALNGEADFQEGVAFQPKEIKYDGHQSYGEPLSVVAAPRRLQP